MASDVDLILMRMPQVKPKTILGKRVKKLGQDVFVIDGHTFTRAGASRHLVSSLGGHPPRHRAPRPAVLEEDVTTREVVLRGDYHRGGGHQRGDWDDDELEEDDFDLKTEMREGAVIGDARGGGYNLSWSDRHVGRFKSFDDALKAAAQRAHNEGFWPNLFYVNDHGNVDLLSYKPRIVKGRVVSVTHKSERSWV